MGQLVKEVYDNWSEGANTSIEYDELPKTAFPLGKNTYLKSIGNGNAIVAKRKGGSVLNAAPVTGSSAIIGQHEFKRRSGGAFTSSHLLVSDNGRLDKVSTTGTLTTIDATAFTSSTAQEYLPDFEDANNLCFIVNGVQAKKYDGTTLSTFGIVEPSTAPTLTGGAAGSHNGTYEGRVTYYNSATGHESSAGPTSSTVTVANKKIDWSAIPVSSDAQVTSRKLYIRNTATQANFYFVTTIADNVTTTYTSDLLDSSLTVVGPDRASNDPPPTGTKYLAWHKSRMFAATDSAVYFSPVEDPESFDPDDFEPVNPDDSQKIAGIIAAFNVLVIFKTHSMYVIAGDDPDTWEVELIDPIIGCVAHRGIVFAGGKLYWWSQQGPVVWDGSGLPILLKPLYLERTLAPNMLEQSLVEMAKICASEDQNEHRVIWAVPEVDKTRNTILFPYNHTLERWESTGWDPFDVASMASVEDADGRLWINMGGYSGQVFRWWSTDHDGIDLAATYTGTFVAGATSTTTITDGTASFPTTGGKYIERKVTVVNSNGDPVDDVRPRITTNTGTVLTLSDAINNFIVGQTYTYYVGGPAFKWTTAWLTNGDAFFKKRYQHCFIAVRPTNADVILLVDIQTDYRDVALGTETTHVSGLVGSLWDQAIWDVSSWDSIGTTLERFRIGKTGKAVQVRIQNYVTNAGLDLLKIGLTAEMLSDKLG